MVWNVVIWRAAVTATSSSNKGRRALTTSSTLTPAVIADELRRTGYLPSEGLATVVYLATAMNRPLLLEGEPGTGKTALAEAWASVTGAELIRLQCYEGIEASQALYDWDFARQILHIRAVEAAAGNDLDARALEESLFDERFLLERPILKALRSANAVLLIDEIDRADDEFEAFLLEVLSTFAVTIPEYGEVRATHAADGGADLQPDPRAARRPEAALPLPLDRPSPAGPGGRDHPDPAAGGERRPGGAGGRPRCNGSAVTTTSSSRRASPRAWTGRGRCIGSARDRLDVGSAAETLGAVLKYREDAERTRRALAAILAR